MSDSDSEALETKRHLKKSCGSLMPKGRSKKTKISQKERPAGNKGAGSRTRCGSGGEGEGCGRSSVADPVDFPKQCRARHLDENMIPVAVSDVVLSMNSVAVIIFTVYQVLIYDRGNQKVSKACLGITTVVLLTAVICVILAWPNHSWIWLISVFNTIQVFMAAIKYIPQAFMNFCRKSTVGWSIRYILLDVTGGLLNLAQMGMQSIDQGTLVNFYGNFGKTLLSIMSDDSFIWHRTILSEVVMFDVLFILQHYVLYPVKDEGDPIILEEHITPLIHPEAKPDFKNV